MYLPLSCPPTGGPPSAGADACAVTPPTQVDRVLATVAAQALIERLRSEHGDLVFHQSGGCCDNSSACCLLPGEITLGAADLLLGHVGGVPYYCPRNQYAAWSHTQLIVDVIEATGGGSFSLEGSLDLAFIVRSRVFSAEERVWLAGHPPVSAVG